MSKLFEGLNEKQIEGVRAIDGPVLVIAAAGSGKTRVLTNRIAYLIEKGVAPEEILAVTFTNKAAGEMRERIANLLKNKNSSMPMVGTFHSIGAKFLRAELGTGTYNSDFTIYDSDDQLNLIKNVMAELEIDSKKLEEMRYILEKAEMKIAKKSEKILVEMYWEIGNALKNESYEDLVEIKQMLSDMLNVEKDVFEKSYAFYQNNSIKEKAMRIRK